MLCLHLIRVFPLPRFSLLFSFLFFFFHFLFYFSVAVAKTHFVHNFISFAFYFHFISKILFVFCFEVAVGEGPEGAVSGRQRVARGV